MLTIFRPTLNHLLCALLACLAFLSSAPTDPEARAGRADAGYNLFRRYVAGAVSTWDVLLAVLLALVFWSNAASLALMLLTNFAQGMDIAMKTKSISVIHLLTAAEHRVELLPDTFWGIMGSAVATVMSAAFSFGSYMVMSQRLYFVPHNWSRILAVAALAVCFALAGNLLLPGFYLLASTLLAKLGMLCLYTVISLFIIFGVQDAKALLARINHRLPVKLG